MKISTRGRYAVTAMMDLAINHPGQVTLVDISTFQGISTSYLEQIFANLRRGGLVMGTRGPRGGYRLARPADEISIAHILSAVNESVDTTRCAGKQNCHNGEPCLTHELWSDLSGQIQEFLNGITLGEFINRSSLQEIVSRQRAMYSQRATTRPHITHVA